MLLLVSTIAAASAARAQPDTGWEKRYWVDTATNVLADPWPSADVVGYLPEHGAFDSPHRTFVVHNDYAEATLEDGTMGWIPLSAGLGVICHRR